MSDGLVPLEQSNGVRGGWVVIAEHELHLAADIVVPDISGWRVERDPSDETTSYSVVAPDWLCAITSPSTKNYDRFEKLAIYGAHGVKHCWCFDPIDNTLDVYILTDTGYKIDHSFTGTAIVSGAPFEQLSFNPGRLWTSSNEPLTP